jgi:hypothetical protein
MYWYFIQQTKKGSASKKYSKQSLLGHLAHLNAISKCSMQGIGFPF